MPEESLNQSRKTAADMLQLGHAFAALPIAFLAYENEQSILIFGALALSLAMLSFIIRRLDEELGRCAIAVALVGQVMLATGAFQGHLWQLDVHMYFFVALGAIAALVDLRALIVSAATIVIHHALLTVTLPALVYGIYNATVWESIERTLLHGVAVAVTVIVLGATIKVRIGLVNAFARSHRELQAAMEEATAARERTAQALEVAKEAHQAAEQARSEAEEALQNGQQETRRAEFLAAQVEEQRTIEKTRVTTEQARHDQAMTILRSALETLSQGNLGVRISGTLPETYEDVGTRFDSALEALDLALQEIRSVSGTISVETDEIAAAAADLARRTERQAATLEEITGSTDQLTKLIRATAEDAGEAEAVMITTGKEAQTGAEVMNQAIAAMAEIETSAGEVRKITSMIEDIAFQTNLLALNAGVEAARAGDAGRGFAVVASEVRALAQRSSEAANRINALIAQSGDQIERGVMLVHDTGGALEKIIGAVETVTTRISTIAATSDEQATGVNGINAALRDLDRVSQQNATMFEETTAACETLRTSAHGLSAAIRNFGDTGEGQSGSRQAA